MIIIEKNEGLKIPYLVSGREITFDDDLSINLARRERDWSVHIDICHNANSELVIGAAAGRSYVAEIDIPKRQYAEPEAPTVLDEPELDPVPPAPVPLDMDTVTLTLWAI